MRDRELGSAPLSRSLSHQHLSDAHYSGNGEEERSDAIGLVTGSAGPPAERLWPVSERACTCGFAGYRHELDQLARVLLRAPQHVAVVVVFALVLNDGNEDAVRCKLRKVNREYVLRQHVF